MIALHVLQGVPEKTGHYICHLDGALIEFGCLGAMLNSQLRINACFLTTITMKVQLQVNSTIN